MGQQYPVHKPLSEGFKQNLLKFSDGGERADPVKFVGREDLLATLARRVNNTSQSDVPLPNATLVMGPPGAGKTALLRELARQNDVDQVCPVLIQGDTFTSPVALAAAFVEAGNGDQNKLVEQTQHQSHGKMGAGAMFGVGRTKTTIQESMNVRLQQGNTVWSAVASAVPRPFSTVFLVLVDEAQDVTPLNGGPNPILKNLLLAQTGHLKCVSVFGGLMDTDDRLDEVGGSPRLPHENITLGPYSKMECDQATQAFFAHKPFGLEEAIEPKHQWDMCRDIRIASEQYPRHVHCYLCCYLCCYLYCYLYCYLCALAKQLGEGRQAIDWDAALDAGHRRRITYNARLLAQKQYRDHGRTMRQLAMDTSPSEPVTYADVERAVQLCGAKQDVGDTLSLAMHRGVLSPVPQKVDLYQFPLPSMHTYLRHEDEGECLVEMRQECNDPFFAKAT